MYDPFATFPVSCDWGCHIARGSAGGTDYGIPVGTAVRAAFDGVLTNRPPVRFPASGNVAILTRADGVAFYHMHLSRFVTPGRVGEGDIIGYSGGAKGAQGSGSSTGPHVHVNAFDPQGRICDIHDYFTTTAASAGALIIEKEGDMQYAIVANEQSSEFALAGGREGWQPIANAAALRGVKKVLAVMGETTPEKVGEARLSGEEFITTREAFRR